MGYVNSTGISISRFFRRNDESRSKESIHDCPCQCCAMNNILCSGRRGVRIATSNSLESICSFVSSKQPVFFKIVLLGKPLLFCLSLQETTDIKSALLVGTIEAMTLFSKYGVRV